MTRAPRIAVIIPCYNDSDSVAESIASVREQTLDDWECVLVDDGSTDGSIDLMRHAASQDDRISVIKHRVNRGLPAARNTGLAHTAAPLVTFLDADDLMLRRSLEDRLSTFLAEDSHDVAGVYGGVRYEHIDKRLADFPSAYQSGPDTTIDFVTAGGECPFPVHAPLCKRRVIEEVGAFDESMVSGAEDWDLWHRVLRCGYVFKPASTTSLVYRFRPGSMTRAASGPHVQAAIRLIQSAYSVISPECPPATDVWPLPLSLADYRREITIANRGVRFAAMATLEGRGEEAFEILEQLPVSNWSLILRHIDLSDLVERAVRRVGGGDVIAVRSQIIRLIGDLLQPGG